MSLVLVAVVIAVLPWVVGKYFVALALLVGIYVIAATGLTLLMGFAGQVSLAQAAFYGIGAYASTILTTRLGVPVWLGIVIAPVVAGLVAWMIGGPSLRLHGHYLALATLAFGIIVFIVFLEASALTGGPSGTIGIPRLRLGPWMLTQDREYYHVVWAVALAVTWGARRLVGSSYGRLLRALAASESGAAAMGVDAHALKLRMFVLSAALGALAGALYAHWITVISPSAFGFEVSIEFVVMVVVGGVASAWGPLLGVIVVTALVEILRSAMPTFRPGAAAEFEVLAFGLLLIAVMVFLPEGLAGLPRHRGERTHARTV
jgi:branched-chain amino acid transport system permease protein